MSEILEAIAEDPYNIEWIPLDLSGCTWSERIQIYSIYATYGKDPERRKLCRKKWKEELKHAGE